MCHIRCNFQRVFIEWNFSTGVQDVQRGRSDKDPSELLWYEGEDQILRTLHHSPSTGISKLAESLVS
jgi:hypothetical protein